MDTRRPGLLLAVLFAAAGRAAAGPPDPAEWLAREAAAFVAPDSRHGIAAAWVGPGGTGLAAFGRCGAADTRLLDGETLFEVGSLTKVFTCLLLALRVEEGGLALETPVAGLLPAEVGLAGDPQRPLRLLHLATHRSGLPRLPGEWRPADPADPYADYTEERLYRFLAAWRPGRAPDEAYEYSNLGVALLGQLLAREAGKDYGELLRERLLDPLGLAGAGLAVRRRLARGHGPRGEEVPSWNLGLFAPAGGLKASARDLQAFLRACLGGGSPAFRRAFALTAEPRAAAGPGVQVGLGWHLRPLAGGTALFHSGRTGGFRAFLGLMVEKGAGVALLCNRSFPDPPAGPSLDRLGFALLARLAGAGTPGTLPGTAPRGAAPQTRKARPPGSEAR